MEPITSVSSSPNSSWIQKHVEDFVLPSIRQIKQLPAASSNHRAAKHCRYPELGVIKSALMSWSNPRFPHSKPIPLWWELTSTQHDMFSLKTAEDYPLQEHSVCSHPITIQPSQRTYGRFSLLHTMVKNSVRDLRVRLRTGCKVILLGRDVWPWAILCEKYAVPYVYEPRISRLVAGSVHLYEAMIDVETNEGDILFDTGFAGTIHRYVQDFCGRNLENLMFSAGRVQNQQFPNYGLSRNRALALEYLPKYFKTGTIREGKVVQELASLPEFISAAALTVLFWYHESPAWIPGAKKTGKELSIMRRPFE